MPKPTNVPKDMPSLGDKLKNLPQNAFLLANVYAEDVTHVAASAAATLTGRGFSGVFVSLAKDYLSATVLLEVAGADVSRMKFIDAASRVYGITPVESSEVIYVDGPLSIDPLIDAVAASLEALSGKRFVVLDSLTSILLYNTPEKTLAFGKKLRTLLKKEGVIGVVVLAYQDSINQDLVQKLEKAGGEAVIANSGTVA